jgi:hypothetical protein
MSFNTQSFQNLNLKKGIKTTTYKFTRLSFKPLPQTFFPYHLLDPHRGCLRVTLRAR